jgi:hypothetical protein
MAEKVYKNYQDLNQKSVMSIRESVKTYIVPSKSDKSYVVNKKQYVDIMEAYMKKLGYYLITTGDEITLPCRLGSFKVYRYNQERIVKELKKENIKVIKMVNFKKTKDLKSSGIDKTVYTDNKATYGYWFKVKWIKFDTAKFKYKSLYSFKLLRTLVRNNNCKDAKYKPPAVLIEYFREKGWTEYSELPRTPKGTYKFK